MRKRFKQQVTLEVEFERDVPETHDWGNGSDNAYLEGENLSPEHWDWSAIVGRIDRDDSDDAKAVAATDIRYAERCGARADWV